MNCSNKDCDMYADCKRVETWDRTECKAFEPLKEKKDDGSKVPCSVGLVAAIHRYKDACDAACNCPNMILSSGRTEEAAKLMQEVEDSKEAMFKMAGN